MTTPIKKFQTLLRELFQFEHADLNFGVYRIMNLRRDRMERWLNTDLPKRARQILHGTVDSFEEDIALRLEGLAKRLLDVQPDAIDADGNLVALHGTEAGKEYARLFAQQKRAPVRTAADLEVLVYNHLYDFFSRYYDMGDFIPKRRRSFAPDGRDTYAVPWDGEEVVLHWANKDQYYIKTGDRFTHYRWQSNVSGHDYTIEFRLTDADLPANNNKEAKKKFHLPLADKIAWDEPTKTLVIPFHYRGLTPEEEAQIMGNQEAKIRENVTLRTIARLRELPTISNVPQLVTALMAPKRDADNEAVLDKDGNPVTLLRHHLNRWAMKNEADFFIHKNLRRFLSGELDYYLKSVVLNIDNLLAAGEIRAESNFRLLEAVKKLGVEVIDFLAQLENFQKALFEKKRFVIETHWCLTLDRVPEALYPEISANASQREDWVNLYSINEIERNLTQPGYSEPLTIEFIKANPYLVLDTRYFDRDFRDKLLESIENVDEWLDGVCFAGDNTDTLRLINERYLASIACACIDPPYNTGNDEFCYKDGYKSSTWLAHQGQTLPLAKELLTQDGSLFAFNDENEARHYAPILEAFFGHDNFVETIIWNKRIPKNDKGIGNIHDFVFLLCKNLAYRKSINKSYNMRKEELDDIYDLIKKCKGRGLTLQGTQEELKKFYRKQGYDRGITLYCELDPNYRPWGKINMSWPNAKNGPRYEVISPVTNRPVPIPENGWRWIEESYRAAEKKGPIYMLPDGSMMKGLIWYSAKETVQPSSITYLDEVESFLLRSILSVKSDGSVTLEHLGLGGIFDHPKSVLLLERLICSTGEKSGFIIDYFAGSGTSGHAIINLNREDQGARKYLLVEQGSYFDTVLIPRLKKVIYATDWKNAKPQSRNTGTSHALKIVRLENYEDALDNIEFNSAAVPGAELGLNFCRDYELRYALDWESRQSPTHLSVERLETPFDYTITLRRESGSVTIKPDLPETFSYLIGLHVRRRFWAEREGHRYLIFTGTLHADGTEVAVLWRTCRDWSETELQKEKDWWREQQETLAPGAARIYVNAASAIDGHLCLDLEFKRRMHPASDNG